MNLRQHLEDLRNMRGRLSYLIADVEAAIRRQDATAAPVKAFEDHWKSMGRSCPTCKRGLEAKFPTATCLDPWHSEGAMSQADGHAEPEDEQATRSLSRNAE